MYFNLGTSDQSCVIGVILGSHTASQVLPFAVLSNMSHFWKRNIVLLLIPFGRNEVDSLNDNL